MEAEDALGQWIAECCDRAQFVWGGSSELFASWRQWADQAGEYVGSQKRFSQALEARGFKPKRDGKTGRAGFEALAAVRKAATQPQPDSEREPPEDLWERG
jgi:phage/plasmid-associated DNA primase